MTPVQLLAVLLDSRIHDCRNVDRGGRVSVGALLELAERSALTGFTSLAAIGSVTASRVAETEAVSTGAASAALPNNFSLMELKIPIW
jgi:hypothetical protein